MAAGYADDLTLDRIDNNRGYSPDNCQWSTQMEQQNHRRNNILIPEGDRLVTVAEYAREIGVPYTTLYNRVKKQLNA